MRYFFLSMILLLAATSTAYASAESAPKFELEILFSFQKAVKSAWSPNGRYLAVAQADWQLTIIEPTRPGNTAVFSEPIPINSLNGDFSWSPDSQYLLVTYVAPYTSRPVLIVYEVQSSQIVFQLIPREKYPSWVSDWYIRGEWSPDNRHILFYSSLRSYSSEDLVKENLFIVDLMKAGDDKVVFRKFVDTSYDINSNILHQVKWSPNGQLVAGVHTLDGTQSRFYVLDPFSNKEVFEMIPSAPDQKDCWGDDLKWSPNSLWILASYSCRNQRQTFLVIDPKKSFDEAIIFTSQSILSEASWTPDSKNIWSYLSSYYYSDLLITPVLKNANNSEKRYRLSIDDRGGNEVQLSPNGRFLVYRTSYLGEGKKYNGIGIFDFVTETRIFSQEGNLLTPKETKWSPDSKKISFVETDSSNPGSFLLKFID